VENVLMCINRKWLLKHRQSTFFAGYCHVLFDCEHVYYVMYVMSSSNPNNILLCINFFSTVSTRFTSVSFTDLLVLFLLSSYQLLSKFWTLWLLSMFVLRWSRSTFWWVMSVTDLDRIARRRPSFLFIKQIRKADGDSQWVLRGGWGNYYPW
jgi:hypothetical protein